MVAAVVGLGIGASLNKLDAASLVLDLVFLDQFYHSAALSILHIVFYVKTICLSWRSETTKKRCP
jgi:hypothetical protein